MADIFYIDGQFVESDKAVIPVQDITILRGYGIFDFLRTYNKQPFFLDLHVERLLRSAAKIQLKLPWTKDEIMRICQETLAKNPHHVESGIRIVVTGGESSNDIVPEGNSRLIVMVTPLKEPPQSWYHDGVKVITFPVTRYLPEAKTINYLSAVIANEEAYNQDAVEAIYISPVGNVLEGTTTNIFFFKAGSLISPEDDILSGVTRRIILDLARHHFPIEIRSVTRNELPYMSEIFISSSSKEIVPVVRIDDQQIGDGAPGSYTKQMMKIFADYVRSEHH